MTWVIGTPTMFGSTLLLGDIQVTVPTPRGPLFIDGVRKVFPVSRFLAAGFAGSVELGYRLIDDLMRVYRFPDNDSASAWIPGWVAMRWSRRARWLHPQIARAHQRVELLFGGVSPTEDNGIPGMAKTFACIFRSPRFEVEVIPWMKVGAIGSGNGVQQYSEVLTNFNEVPMTYMQAEVAGPGLMATTLAGLVGMRVAEVAAPGISRHFLVCSIKRGSITFGANDTETVHPGGRKEVIRMPQLAGTLPQVHDLLRRHGVADALADAEA